MADQQENWEHHEHEAVVHSHPHFHVTHNFNKYTSGFDHLSSQHEHEHDHPAIAHAHWPHQDFEEEHHGEAHLHDHGEPVKTGRAPKKATKKATGKKATAKKTGKRTSQKAAAKKSSD